jgi:anti-anti-sigma regulatory factor
MSSPYDDPTAVLLAERARAAQRARCGDHLCSFYGSEDEHRRVAAAFVASALGAGDRVVYVASDHAPAAIGGLLAKGGVDPEEPLRSGQLMVLDFAALFGLPADMTLDAVLARYRDEADRSRAAGYPGLRVAVEMGGLVERLGSLEELERWEHVVENTFRGTGVTAAVCQYDGRRFNAAARQRIAAEHAAVAVDDGTMPLATFSATQEFGALVVAGELDLSTAPPFARTLRARAAVSPHVDVDVAGVTFADVTGLRTVFEVASELPSGSVLVLSRTPPALRRLLGLLGWRDPRVRVEPL